MAIDVTRRLFTVEEYERMGSAGILGEDDRVELIDGEIVEMAPIGPRHSGCVNRLNRWLVTALGDRAVVSVQHPLRVWPRSEPEPDLVVARPRDDFYSARHPEPGDALLVVEVADSSLAFDLGRKARLYARAGAAELWVVDLPAGTVVVHRDPSPDGYADVRTAGPDDHLAPSALPDVVVAVADLVGPR